MNRLAAALLCALLFCGCAAGGSADLTDTALRSVSPSEIPEQEALEESGFETVPAEESLSADPGGR